MCWGGGGEVLLCVHYIMWTCRHSSSKLARSYRHNYYDVIVPLGITSSFVNKKRNSFTELNLIRAFF